MHTIRTALGVTLGVALLVAGCGHDSSKKAAPSPSASGANQTPTTSPLPQGSQPVQLDPANFVRVIDNPYLPMKPGASWTYERIDPEGGKQQVKVVVTDRTKTILGITATVLHDVVSDGDQLVEDTVDWYAQDKAGNIWYLGEDTKEYQNGKVSSTAGTWQAGVDGAQPGILVLGQPEPGLTYRQEYYRGQAEDLAQVLSLDERVEVPAGLYDNALMTRERTPLEPKLSEHKFYAKGVGLVLTLAVSGGADREQLVRYAPAP